MENPGLSCIDQVEAGRWARDTPAMVRDPCRVGDGLAQRGVGREPAHGTPDPDLHPGVPRASVGRWGGHECAVDHTRLEAVVAQLMAAAWGMPMRVAGVIRGWQRVAASTAR